MCFEYLHLDMIPIIFSYLSQYELLYILLTNKLIYFQIMKYINTTKFMIIDSDNKLRYGCENNLIISIKQIKIQLDWNNGLYGACLGGHESIIKLMIENGANHWNSGLHYACSGGNISIVKLMIVKGANDWNCGLYYACLAGNKSIVKLMIDKGSNYWNWGLQGVCKGNHINLVNLMIEKGAKYCNYCNKSISEHIKN